MMTVEERFSFPTRPPRGAELPYPLGLGGVSPQIITREGGWEEQLR